MPLIANEDEQPRQRDEMAAWAAADLRGRFTPPSDDEVDVELQRRENERKSDAE